MEFVLYCIDKPARTEARRAVRPAHLRYISGRQQSFRFGGPLMDDLGHVRGSLMIIDAPDRAALDSHMRGDPFFGADLFESVTVWSSRQVIPERVGGSLQAEIDALPPVVATA